MALPRSKYVQEDQEGVYHCFSRCVRRAFLCGFDSLTLRDFSHRKAWLVDRLRYLAAVFAIEVCAYAVLATHYHSILRLRPDLAASWSDREVARRWLTLFPPRRRPKGPCSPPSEQDIRALTDRPDRIALLRKRLCSLSWFMGRLNEFIARAANHEDQLKGRFWEGRFKCQALLDEAAIVSCMAYVDLNPIRAGLAATPEDSDFTSIQQRIRAWQKESLTPGAVPGEAEPQPLHSPSLTMPATAPDDAARIPGLIPDGSPLSPHPSDAWLCPIPSEPGRRGILSMTAAEYFDLVDRSGRMMRSDKRGSIDPDLVPILLRIGANPDAWLDTVSRFGSRFRLAAGLVSNLRGFANRLGRRWLQGVATARAAFRPPQPQVA
jgi:REP element-mobilizing transposase RayT